MKIVQFILLMAFLDSSSNNYEKSSSSSFSNAWRNSNHYLKSKVHTCNEKSTATSASNEQRLLDFT